MTIPLPEFKKTNILVIGDIMLDRYWSGPSTRVSPEAPVPVVKITEIEDRLGGAANVAKNLSTLGCNTTLCGVIGDDDAGNSIISLLKKHNIHNAVESKSDTQTITKLRVLSRHQQLLRLDFEEPSANTAPKTLLKNIDALIEKADVVILSDYAKGTILDAASIINTCRKKDIPIFVDPKGHNFSRYKNANFITPNKSEFELEAGKCANVEEIFEKAEKLKGALTVDGILVTLGEKGMALVNKNEVPHASAATAKDVYDVTGAGDTVIATFAASYAAGTNTRDAMRLANIAAGIVVGKLGTSSVTPEELIAAQKSEARSIQSGILNFDELMRQLNESKTKGERIVFTNGCFDILHAGHIQYLEKAAELGDRLIVAVNSDESIKRLKGENRPILSLNERMKLMASMRCVDWVISFEEDTPIKLIKQIMPDTLVKGGDYKKENIVGFKEVTNNGGETHVIPYVDGHSTTSIVEKIKSLVD